MSAWHIRRTERTIDAADFSSGPAPDCFPSTEKGTFLHLFFDAPDSVNVLSTEVLEELSQVLTRIEGEPGVEALFLWSAKEKHFIAGAHVDEIAAIEDRETARAKAAQGQELFTRFSRLSMPTFAMIRGTCLGGGLELALAFDYRLAVDDPATRIGLPEVHLGIIPGFGGCQRLPRLVGIRTGLTLILGGQRLPARAAHRKGVVDLVVPPEGFFWTAVAGAQKILADGGARVRGQRARRRGRWAPLFLEKNPLGRVLVAHLVRKAALKKTQGHYPAVPAAIEAVVKGFGSSMEEGLRREATLVGNLVGSDVSKKLIAIFQDSERARRLTLDPGDGPPWSGQGQVGVLGAGVMGAGIAALLLKRGYPVRLRDIEGESLRRGLALIGSRFESERRRRRLTEREREERLDRLTSTTEARGFSRVEGIIEAVVEKLPVKHAALSEIESGIKDTALLLTNTSALSVTSIQKGVKHPERVVGLHFFNPVHRMPLVEVIPGQKTAPWAVAQAVTLSQSLGKFPVVVQDSPGFLVNRVLVPYMDAACRMLEEGIEGPEIDRVAVAFGLPMGPFRLLDEVGIDIAVEVSETLQAAFSDRFRGGDLFQRFLEHGQLGRKTGAGFYVYPDAAKATPTWNTKRLGDLSRQPREADDVAIADRLVDPIVDEAARCLEEGIVEGPAQVDLAMIMGTGFPPFRGGPLRHADQVGIDKIAARLRGYPGVEPCALVERLAREGHGFYSLEQPNLKEADSRAPV